MSDSTHFERGSWQYADMEGMLEYLQRAWTEASVAVESSVTWGFNLNYESAKSTLRTISTSSIPTLQAMAVNGAAGVAIDVAAWWDLATSVETSLSKLGAYVERGSSAALTSESLTNLTNAASAAAKEINTGLPWVALAVVGLAVIAMLVRFG